MMASNGVVEKLALTSIFVSGIYIETGFFNIHATYLLMGMSAIGYLIKTKSENDFDFRGVVAAIVMVWIYSVFASLNFSDWSYYNIQNILIDLTAKCILFLIYIYVFVNLIKKNKGSAIGVFNRYIDVAVIFSIIGVIQQLHYILLGRDLLEFSGVVSKHYDGYLGIAGLSAEPAFYACALMPAASYFIIKLLTSGILVKRLIWVLVAIIMSTSSLGYMGVMVSIIAAITINLLRGKLFIAMCLVAILIAIWSYAVDIDFFSLRYLDTISFLYDRDLTMRYGMNLSTYSIGVNFEIAKLTVLETDGFGVGFGQYYQAFDRYILGYEIPGYRDTIPGRGSGASLFFRGLAEMGWIWIVLLIILAIRLRVKGVDWDLICLKAALISSFVIILLRMGEYYLNGIIFFALLYFFASKIKFNSPS